MTECNKSNERIRITDFGYTGQMKEDDVYDSG